MNAVTRQRDGWVVKMGLKPVFHNERRVWIWTIILLAGDTGVRWPGLGWRPFYGTSHPPPITGGLSIRHNLLMVKTEDFSQQFVNGSFILFGV